MIDEDYLIQSDGSFFVDNQLTKFQNNEPDTSLFSSSSIKTELYTSDAFSLSPYSQSDLHSSDMVAEQNIVKSEPSLFDLIESRKEQFEPQPPTLFDLIEDYTCSPPTLNEFLPFLSDSRTFSENLYTCSSTPMHWQDTSFGSTGSFCLSPDACSSFDQQASHDSGLGSSPSSDFLAATEVNTAATISQRPYKVKYPVPEELKAKIQAENPGQGIRFLLSQRANAQMMVSGYVLKKKKGPMITLRGRTIHWRCTIDSCPFTATTHEGALVIGKRGVKHNHSPQPAKRRLERLK